MSQFEASALASALLSPSGFKRAMLVVVCPDHRDRRLAVVTVVPDLGPVLAATGFEMTKQQYEGQPTLPSGPVSERDRATQRPWAWPLGDLEGGVTAVLVRCPECGFWTIDARRCRTHLENGDEVAYPTSRSWPERDTPSV